jgi:Lrp/AsnC family transcriptional regulator, leucine-responsive regulatory protein
MIDDIDRAILQALLIDARLSLKGLARQVGLSSPSVAERLQRLKERGVIQAFTIEIDPRALGYEVQAVVRVRPLPGKLRVVQKLLEDTPEICECDKVTGDDCYVVRLLARSIEDLDRVLDRLADLAATSTAVVKAKTTPRRAPQVALTHTRRAGRASGQP